MDHPEDEPPFALPELHSPQHLSFALPSSTSASPSPRAVTCMPEITIEKSSMTDLQVSTHSSPPGLVESTLSEGSSAACESDLTGNDGSAYLDSSSTFLLSSLPTVSSAAGSSSRLFNSRVSGQLESRYGEGRVRAPEASSQSAGFSQLLQAADNAERKGGQSTMPTLPEHDIMESSDLSGALISPPGQQESFQHPSEHWFTRNQTLRTAGMRDPLIDSPSSELDAPLLTASPSLSSIEAAKRNVRSCLLDGQSFEVSVDLESQCTVQGMIDIIANPDLFKLWCEPIHTLVVTSTSDNTQAGTGQQGNGRQYEGEWIEATTTALESPPSWAGPVLSAGRAVMDTLGFSTYGKVTMFVERQRGQVGLTVGPFSGDMCASHTMYIRAVDGRVRIVDRVRLEHDKEASGLGSLLQGTIGSCLASCLLPSTTSYMNQVTTSMARLRLLAENTEFAA